MKTIKFKTFTAPIILFIVCNHASGNAKRKSTFASCP
jgi:hypothetical protein